MTIRNSIQSAKYDAGQAIGPKIAPLTLAIGSVLATGPVLADSITVNSLSGQYDVDLCTLRAAIDTANTGDAGGFNCNVPSNPNPTIQFAPSLEGTIELDADQDGSLVIDESMRIDGDNRITIANTTTGRVFDATSNVGIFAVEKLEISGGDAVGGGAIRSQASELEIIESVITGNTSSLGSGGGVSHNPPESGGALRIRDSEFTNNVAYGAGGGVYVNMTGGQIQIDDNFFGYNDSKYGGGLAIEAEDTNALFVKYNTFSNNQATLDEDGTGGGAIIELAGVDSPEIKYNTFVNNTASTDGGGMALVATNSNDIGFGENNFTLNEAEDGSGGGLFAELVGGSFYSTDLEFSNNNAGVHGGGAQIAADGSAIGIQNSLFKYNNAATSVNGFGGGIRISGDPEDVGLSYTSIRDNRANGGVGIALAGGGDGTFVIENSEISNNEVQAGATGNGGGILANLGENAQFFLTNSTVSGNTGGTNGGGVRMVGAGTIQAKYSTIVGNEAQSNGGGISLSSDQGICLVRNTVMDNQADGQPQDIAGGDCGVSSSLLAAADQSDFSDGGGNILNQDPMLESLSDNGGPGTRSHRPMEGSPVIDAGSTFGDAPEFDQRGTGFDRVSGDAIDMGALEIQVLDDEIFQDRFETN